MSYDKVAKADRIKIGTKQTVKALQSGIVKEVYVAADANPMLVKKAIDLATEKAIPVNYVDSMQKLGEICGIDVKAAAVSIVNE